MITNGLFPEGEAGALRIKYIAKALASKGCNVTVLCRGISKDSGLVDGIQYYSFRNVKAKGIKKIIDYFSFPSNVKEYLRTNEPVDSIYVYNAHISIFTWLKKYAKETNVRLVHDCVEWYSPEEFKHGRFDPSYIIKNHINTRVLNEEYRVIAISQYLADYYSNKGISSLRVPMLCDCSAINATKELAEDKVQLFYAGNPGGKDLVGNVIQALNLLSEEDRSKVSLTVIGCTKERLVNACGVNEETIECAGTMLEIIGRVPHEEVLQRMSTANFVVLSRNASLRYAQAGFPSKIVESLANSTPVLCNISSDLGDYLIDGQNAVISSDHTPEAFAEAIHCAVMMTYEQRKAMCLDAFKSAENFFDYRNYNECIYRFIVG